MIKDHTPDPAKPWCNYSIHRTTSAQRGAGMKSSKIKHGVSKRRAYRRIDQWWHQAVSL